MARARLVLLYPHAGARHDSVAGNRPRAFDWALDVPRAGRLFPGLDSCDLLRRVAHPVWDRGILFLGLFHHRDDRILGGFMKRTISAVVVTLALALTALAQGTLTFVTKALDSKDCEYTTYLDLSTKHMEGTYTVITSYALWATPVTSDGYSGIKWYKNVLDRKST